MVSCRKRLPPESSENNFFVITMVRVAERFTHPGMWIANSSLFERSAPCMNFLRVVVGDWCTFAFESWLQPHTFENSQTRRPTMPSAH